MRIFFKFYRVCVSKYSKSSMNVYNEYYRLLVLLGGMKLIDARTLHLKHV